MQIVSPHGFCCSLTEFEKILQTDELGVRGLIEHDLDW